MSLLSGFNITLPEVALLGEAAMAAFAGGAVPKGWDVVKPEQLGVAPQYWDGNYFNNNGASAIVLRLGSTWIVSFRGTDGPGDILRYPELVTGAYINHFQPLLNAVASNAEGATFYFTGASLGGGATNLMANIAGSQYGGEFASAKFVAFASPIISNANGILNVGFENDPVYRALNGYNDFSSSLDNLVLATSQYVQGNYDGLHPPDQYAHNAALGFKALGQLQTSMFFSEMSPDSVVIFDAFNGMLQDITPGRDNTGVFYLGENVADSILGRNGGDHIEGFAGNDSLDGGAGDDTVAGGAGDDALFGGSNSIPVAFGTNGDNAFFTGNRANYTVTFDATTTTFTLTDTRVDSPDGKDTATGFEFYIFADKAVSAETLQAEATAPPPPPPPGGGVSTPDADIIAATDAAGQNIDALGGADQVTGLGGPDTLIGGEGADALVGAGGNDSLDGGTGADSINAGDGNDTVQGGADADQVAGDAGNDLILLGDGNDFAVGGTGDDTIGGGGAIDQLNGNEGNDSLVGGDQSDQLAGGDGADTLDAGPGANFLSGGAGADLFILTKGGTNASSLADFQAGVDKLQLVGFGAGATLTANGNGTWTVTSAGGATETFIMGAANPATDVTFAP